MESHDESTRESYEGDNDIEEIADNDDQKNEVPELKNQNEENVPSACKNADSGSESSDDSDDEVETTDDESEGSDTGELTTRNDDVVKEINDDVENSRDEESSDNDDDDEDISSIDESDDADDEDSCHSSSEIVEQDESNEGEEKNKETIPVCNSNIDTNDVAETIYELSDECYENQGECTCLLYSEADETDGRETVGERKNVDEDEMSRTESFDCNKTFVVKQCTCNSAKTKKDINDHSGNGSNTNNDVDDSDKDQNGKRQECNNECEGGIDLEENSATPQTASTHDLNEGGIDSYDSLNNATTATTQNNTVLPSNEQDGVANLRNSFRREKSKLLDTSPSLERLVNEIEEEYTVDLMHQKTDGLRRTENELYELEAQILMDYG